MTYETAGYTLAALAAAWLAAHYLNALAMRRVDRAVDQALADTAPVAPVVWGWSEYLALTSDDGWLGTLADIDELPSTERSAS